MYSIGPGLEVVGHSPQRIDDQHVQLDGVKYTGGDGIYVADGRWPARAPGLMWDSLAGVNAYRAARGLG